MTELIISTSTLSTDLTLSSSIVVDTTVVSVSITVTPTATSTPMSAHSAIPSSDPTSSTSKAISSGMPKVGGSVGGFIGLVVALSIIILVSCTAVYFLLRDRQPSKQEREIRRQRVRRYRRQADALASSSPFNYSATSQERRTQPWKQRLRAFLPVWGKGRQQGGHGWVQAGSRDDWDIYSEDEEEGRPVIGQGGNWSVDMAQAEGSRHVPHTAYRTPYNPQPQSSSSVDLQLHAPGTDRPSGSSHDPPAPIMDRGVRSTSPEPLPGTRTQSLRPGHGEHDDRNFSTQSGDSMMKQEGGTKFIESL